MNLDDSRIESSIRISWGADVEKEEVLKGVSKLIEIAKELA